MRPNTLALMVMFFVFWAVWLTAALTFWQLTGENNWFADFHFKVLIKQEPIIVFYSPERDKSF